MYGQGENAQLTSTSDLIEVIRDLDKKGMVPFSVTQITAVKVRDPGTPWEQFDLPGYANKGGRTYFAKVSLVSGNLNINYTDKVNRERVSEGMDDSFEAKPDLKYDHETKALRKLKSTGAMYLFYYPVATAADFETVYVGVKDSTFVIADYEEVIKPLLPAVKESSGRQGLKTDDQVIVRNLSFASIAGFRANKQDYIVSDLDPIRADIYDLVFNAANKDLK